VPSTEDVKRESVRCRADPPGERELDEHRFTKETVVTKPTESRLGDLVKLASEIIGR
jgi:hypothetical protein